MSTESIIQTLIFPALLLMWQAIRKLEKKQAQTDAELRILREKIDNE